MDLLFCYDCEKDIENIIQGTKSTNSKVLPRFQREFVQQYGPHFDSDTVALFITEQDKIYRINPEISREQYAQRWQKIAVHFVLRAEKIFGQQCQLPDITVYLSHSDRCTYSTVGRYFFLPLDSPFSNNIIMHELFHFYTWYCFYQKLMAQGVSKALYNDIKESLTVLLNEEFADLLDGKSDDGYPQHRQMRDTIKAKWRSYTNIVVAINEMLSECTHLISSLDNRNLVH